MVGATARIGAIGDPSAKSSGTAKGVDEDVGRRSREPNI